MSTKKLYWGLFSLASILYIIGTLLAPLTPNKFNLSTSKTHLLQAAIALPIIIIWAIAVYGAERFMRYTAKIKADKDGKALSKVALGLSLLIAASIFNAVFGVLRGWAFRDGWLEGYTIVANYLGILLPAVAYIFMFRGSVALLRLTGIKKSFFVSSLSLVGLLIAIGIVYTFIMFNYDYRNSTPDPSKYSSFYLNDFAILITIIIPYLISWSLGIIAIFNIGAYQRHVKGTIYKSALFRVVVGTLWVTVFYILLQMLVALSTYLSKAGVAAILLFLYLIILLYAAGFLIIASGTRKLNAIEKVQ